MNLRKSIFILFFPLLGSCVYSPTYTQVEVSESIRFIALNASDNSVWDYDSDIELNNKEERIINKTKDRECDQFIFPEFEPIPVNPTLNSESNTIEKIDKVLVDHIYKLREQIVHDRKAISEAYRKWAVSCK